jgi:hypothetical protein
MKMQLEMGAMTEHDKKLLSWMVFVVLLVVLGGFVLLPLAKSNLALEERLSAAQAEKEACEQKIALAGTEQELNDTLLKKRAAAQKDFYPWMESQEIDKMLTTLAVSRGLSALDLSIAMPTDMTKIAPYRYSDAASAAGGQTEAQDTASEVYAAAVTLTVSGDEAELQRLIDDLYADYPAIRIVAYAWSASNVVTGSPANAAQKGQGGSLTLSIDMEIYMVKDEIPAALAADSAASAASQNETVQ